MGMIGEVFALAGLHVDSASFAAYGSALQGAESGVSEFASGTKAIMAGAFVLPAAALAGVAGYGVELASGFQDAGVSLTNLYGSADVAKQKFDWMTNFAAQTPFNFTEIEQGAIKLKSYGMDIETYGRTMGDTASNMGKSFNDVIEAYADAGNGEFERLKEFGVKAVVVQKSNLDTYAKYGAQMNDTVLKYTDKTGKEMAQVVDRNNSQMVYSTLNNIFDVEKGFQGAMETRSKTLTGMMSNITDNLTSGLSHLVGYEDMKVQTFSLMGALTGLAGVAVDVSGAFAHMSEPMQTIILVVAGATAAIGLLAAGSIAYGLILPLITADTFLFGATLSAAIWPVTLIVGGIALLAAGLVYLDEKTGLVTAAWEVAKDAFTIFVEYITIAAGMLYDFIVPKLEEIKQAYLDMIPQGAIDAVVGFASKISDLFGGAASSIHTQAEGIRKDNEETAKSFDTYSNVNMGGTGSQITTVDGLVKTLTGDAKTGTTALDAMGKVPAAGTIAGLTGIDTGAKNATTSGKQLQVNLTALGSVSMGGTTAQLMLIDSTGKRSSLTVSQLQEYLKQAGNVSASGTIGQLALVDSSGKATNITTQQAINLLSSAGSQSMSGTIGGINGITSAWAQANAAANAYAKSAIAQAQAEITYRNGMKDSTSTGMTSKEGVTVIGATPKVNMSVVSPSKTTTGPTVNNYNIGTVNNNGSTLQKTAARRVT